MHGKQMTLWPPLPGKAYRAKTYRVIDPYCPTEEQTLSAASIFKNTVLSDDDKLEISRLRIGETINFWGVEYTRLT